MEQKLISLDDAFKKGYLSKEKVILKPVIRGGKMITDPAHIGYFMFDGASVLYSLPEDSRGILINPFSNEEERKFFESALDVDLNVHKKKDNFWHTFYVRVTKDAAFMEYGIKFDLSDPMDALRVKILKKQQEIADGWDNRYEHPEYKFVLVPENYEDLSNMKELDENQKLWTFYGSIKDSSKKMVDFLSIYLITKKSSGEVPSNPSNEYLATEIKKAFTEDKDIVLKIIDDPDSAIKLFIAKAVRVGSIQRAGLANYRFAGDDLKYTLPELITRVKDLKEITDDLYLKIEAQIKAGEVKNSKTK